MMHKLVRYQELFIIAPGIKGYLNNGYIYQKKGIYCDYRFCIIFSYNNCYNADKYKLNYERN